LVRGYCRIGELHQGHSSLKRCPWFIKATPVLSSCGPFQKRDNVLIYRHLVGTAVSSRKGLDLGDRPQSRQDWVIWRLGAVSRRHQAQDRIRYRTSDLRVPFPKRTPATIAARTALTPCGKAFGPSGWFGCPAISTSTPPLRSGSFETVSVSTSSHMAGLAIPSYFVGHATRSARTRNAPRLKPEHSIGAGHVAAICSIRRDKMSVRRTRSNGG
jgi:hypothetical protein